MPQYRQPASLVKLCEAQACLDLAYMCNALCICAQDVSLDSALEFAESNLRPYYQEHLPGRIREKVIEETRLLLTGAAPLFMLEALLSPDIHYLRVELCCYYGCSHQSKLLSLLASQGHGLKHLELARPALLRLDCFLLEDALTSAKNLYSLKIRNFANNCILKVVGRACPNLKVLDVVGSREVTDVGLRSLFLQSANSKRAPSAQCSRCSRTDNYRDSKATRLASSNEEITNHKNSIGAIRNKRSLSECEDLISAFQGICFMWGRKTCKACREEGCSGVRGFLARVSKWTRLRKNSGHTHTEKMGGCLLDHDTEQQTALCDKLQELHIAGTGISMEGVFLALSCLPRLQSLGDFIFDRLVISLIGHTSIELGLRTAHLSSFHPSHISALAKNFPHLENVTLEKPLQPIFEVPGLKKLSTLHLDNLPYNYVSSGGLLTSLSQHRDNLQELSLNFVDGGDSLPAVDITIVLQCCPMLANLVITGANLCWTETNEPVTMKHLLHIHLGKSVKADVVQKIFSSSPHIETVHFQMCNDLTSKHIQTICESQDLCNLECFYIYKAPLLNVDGLCSILESASNLRKIGNLDGWQLESHWVQEQVEVQNFELDLTVGSHWYGQNALLLGDNKCKLC